MCLFLDLDLEVQFKALNSLFNGMRLLFGYKERCYTALPYEILYNLFYNHGQNNRHSGNAAIPFYYKSQDSFMFVYSKEDNKKGRPSEVLNNIFHSNNPCQYCSKSKYHDQGVTSIYSTFTPSLKCVDSIASGAKQDPSIFSLDHLFLDPSQGWYDDENYIKEYKYAKTQAENIEESIKATQKLYERRNENKIIWPWSFIYIGRLLGDICTTTKGIPDRLTGYDCANIGEKLSIKQLHFKYYCKAVCRFFQTKLGKMLIFERESVLQKILLESKGNEFQEINDKVKKILQAHFQRDFPEIDSKENPCHTYKPEIRIIYDIFYPVVQHRDRKFGPNRYEELKNERRRAQNIIDEASGPDDQPSVTKSQSSNTKSKREMRGTSSKTSTKYSKEADKKQAKKQKQDTDGDESTP